jgi:hypothetical protein
VLIGPRNVTCHCEDVTLCVCVGSRLQQWDALLRTGAELTFQSRPRDEITRIECGN